MIRENAAIGVYVTLTPPTKPMKEEAAGCGFYHSPGWNKDYPRLQILTVEEILSGKDARRRVMPFAEARGLLTDEDIFKLVS